MKSTEITCAQRNQVNVSLRRFVCSSGESVCLRFQLTLMTCVAGVVTGVVTGLVAGVVAGVMRLGNRKDRS